MPVLLVGAVRFAVGIQLVHVRIQLGVEVQTVVVEEREFQTQVNLEITPVHRVGGKVISAGHTELIDDTHYFIRVLTCRVVLVEHLHLQVLVQTEVQGRGHTSTGRVTVRCVLETGHLPTHRHGITVLIHFLNLTSRDTVRTRIYRLVVVVIIPPTVLTEVRMIGHTDTRREYMTEFLHFAVREQFLERRVESVYLGLHADAGVKIKHVIESRRSVPFHLLQIVVPCRVGSQEIHPVTHVDTWRHRQVLKQHKARIDRYTVTHTGRPVPQEIRFQELTLFHVTAVDDLTVHRVTHLDLLKPFLLAADHAFAFECRLAP